MFLARLSLRRSFATLAMNSVASPASSVATATNAANASTVDASTSSSSSAASSTVDLVQWPYHALNAKHIAASDVHDALAAFAGASSSVRSLRILTRTLIGFGGWVVPAHTVLMKDRLTARDIALPPTSDLYMRSDASTHSVLAFSDKSVYDVWRQTAKPTADVVGDISIAEYTTGMRLFDALWSSSAVRALAVRSVRVDADPNLVVPLEPFRNALLVAKIERAAAVLTLYRHGKANAAQRYVAQTFTAFRAHRTFFVVDADHAPLPRSRVFAFTDELLLQDACTQLGITGGPVKFVTLNGSQLVDRLLDKDAAVADALWLNFHTPLALLLPRQLLAELNQGVPK